MHESFTPGALRALRRAECRAEARQGIQVEPIDLIAALLDEPESRAAMLLGEFGLDSDRLSKALGIAVPPAGVEALDELDVEPSLLRSKAFRDIVNDAAHRAKSWNRAQAVGTEHLLACLIVEQPLGARRAELEALEDAGLDVAGLRAHLAQDDEQSAEPIPVASDIPALELADPTEPSDLARILDASANRAREGLRVVEDYVRFVLDDPGLTRRLKDVRHRLAEALRGIDPDLLLGSRDTRGDVGTHIMTASESSRESGRSVLSANFKRTAEALRSLEEYSKLLDSWVAGRFEVLRYDVYTLEKLTLTAAASHRVLASAKLMVLVGGLPTLGDLTWIVGEALAGGADVIQLREKGLDDREWLRRSREVRILTAQARAAFVVNDRPDLARLASADGVHLGQSDISVRDARRIVGPNALVGVSAHDQAQLQAATLDAAGYLGVGPVFSSDTKQFDSYPGLDLVRHATDATSLPWFAIGGINEDTIDEVIEAGARRVAVSGAIVRAKVPREAAAALKARLDNV
jgi:thiamine-phosphate pyrophosphorylase